MAVDFRGHPLFPPGFNSPTRFDADVYDCEVWGQIPTDIRGTFYRMQCDFDYRPPKNEWLTGFNGDGHISRFRFHDGSVDFKGRFIRTARLMAERKERKRLFGVYRNPYTDDPSVAHINRSAANTHSYWHGGKLFVLKEDSLPYHVDPHTLETLGDWNFHGKYTAQTMSAHPKIDPVTGEMIAYGYEAKGILTKDIAVYTISPAGRVTKQVWLTSPYLGIIHDIAITQKHVIIPVIARTSSLERLKSGEPMWDWDGSLPTMVGILPREGDAKDVRWFKGPSRNTLHFLNATDRGNKVTMELPTSSGERDASQIRRWTFDLDSKSDAFQEEVVSTTPGFLPRMDDRYLSLDYRYAFISSRAPAAGADPKAAPTQVVQRLDVHTGEIKQCAIDGKVALQESCFVPRANSKSEGEGYVMTIASNFDTMSSDMIITDAQHLEDGVIATVKLPFRLRSGTHTNWYPQSVLPPIKDELA
ncbi:MAG: carotenoid oxygenase family protein, partial [Steroidobacteraceae bacterium]